MTKLDRSRRPRRIAADEAHSWARNLRLNNPHAKLTLSMLSQYVDADGYCFVSIPTLADDTELSAQTVRSRLAWLEQIGAIARLPQWIDEFGRRSSEGKGKRTSDLIRLLLDADVEGVEAAANGDFEGVSREVSPMPQTGLNGGSETSSPTPALRQPYDSAEGLNSEPEPESSPFPPSRGRESASLDQEDEPELFAAAWQSWRGHEVMAPKRHLAIAEFRKLSAADQRLCRSAIGPYNAMLDKLGRTRTVVDFHKWIRSRGFAEFEKAPTLANHAADSDEARAISVAYDLAGKLDFLHSVLRNKLDGSIPYRLAVTPRLKALASAPPREGWVDLDHKQAAAWEEFAEEVVPLPVRKRVVAGSRAPWHWPPKKDGSIYQPDKEAS